jgi:hypothetical protein
MRSRITLTLCPIRNMLTVGERGTVNSFRTSYDFSVHKGMRVSDKIRKGVGRVPLSGR